MKNQKKIFYLAGVILAMMILVLNVSAQEVAETEEDLGIAFSESPLTSDGTSCFDYYKFQSVQVSLGSAKDEYLSGETITFKGELNNENNYPIVDGNVFARVSQTNPNYTSEGQFIIDEIIALKDISLDANQIKPVQFDWTIPVDAKKGDYRIDFFFSVGKKFNLGGLPFTNEVIVGFTQFKVESTNLASVSFDKSQTQVNKEKYNHIGNLPVIEKGQAVEIIQPITNTYAEDKNTTITYDLYFWDSLNEKDILSSKTEEVIIPANGSIELKYSIDQMSDSVYYLKITATTGNEKSIVNIRLASEQIHPRLNYPAITKFPIRKGDSLTLFSCFHNTSGQVSNNNKLTLALYDKNDELVDQLEYQGDITGAMMADKKDIVAEDNYDYLKLKANLYNSQNEIIDEYETIYNCQDINKDKCEKKAELQIVNTTKTGLDKKTTITLLAILLTVVLLTLIFVPKKEKPQTGKKRRSRKKLNSIVFLIIGSAMLLSGGSAWGYNSKSVTLKNSTYIVDTNTSATISFINVSTTHLVNMTSGEKIMPIGKEINFSHNAEIFFNAVGDNNDSPYGKFISLPETPDTYLSKMVANPTTGGYFYVNLGGSSNRGGYVDIVGYKPDYSIVSSNPSVVSCSGKICVTNSLGKSKLTVAIDGFKANPLIAFNYKGKYRGIKGSLNVLPANLSWNVEVTDSVIDGKCGDRSRSDYFFEDNQWPDNSNFCLEGNPDSSPTFPAPGKTVNWKCVGVNGGLDISCAATRASTVSCVGAIPPGSKKCSGDDTGLRSSFLWLSVGNYSSGCTSRRKCEYYSPICLGTSVENSTLCVGDDSGLTDSVTKKLVTTCSSISGPKCEFTCNEGYIKNGDTCILATCTGVDPINASFCLGDNTGLTINTAKSLVANCTDAKKCEFTCNVGYVYNRGRCILAPTPTPCIPISWSPNQDTICSGTLFIQTSNCDTEKTATGTKVCSTPSPASCLGSVPNNSSPCSGDDSGLTSSLSRKAVSACTNRKCEYRCDAGYRPDNSFKNCIQSCTGEGC